VNPPSEGGLSRPDLLVFDVNETLSDMAVLADRFVEVGASGLLVRTWFAGLLRDGFALNVAGAVTPFAEIAVGSLVSLLGQHDLDRSPEDAAKHVMEGFAALPVHEDVAPGLAALDELGIRMVTLSNGSSDVADALLTRSGLRDRFERLLSVEDADAWKPARSAYAYALSCCDVEASAAMLVAVHPWDVDGANRAGLASAWLNRIGSHYPHHFTAPAVEASSLIRLADLLR
jgi:2-haloacid dehalogenase